MPNPQNGTAHMEAVVREFRQRRFAEAASLAEALIHQAAQASQDYLATVAQSLLGDWRLQPLFGTTADAARAQVYFERILTALESVRGIGDTVICQARQHLAMSYAMASNPERAIPLLESSLTTLMPQLGPYSELVQQIRANLAIQYRNTGQAERTDALYADTGVCEHLKPIEAYIRSKGVRVASAGKAWSQNCRLWVYFEGVVLDVDRLRSRFSTPDVVVVHSFYDPKAGSEHGLVCLEHHDGLMGAHPSAASGCRVIS